jgi:tetratricopeptide (TPR) repeat protein
LLSGINERLGDRPQLDLLHTARRIWKHRLSDCSLTSIEEHVLGFTRVDDIEGWMIPQTFFEYLRGGDRRLLDPIMQHNRLDILSLACLARVVFDALDAPYEVGMQHGLDWFGLGTLFEKYRRLEEAVHCFGRAISVGVPENIKPRCMMSLSLAHKRNGAWEDAVDLWKESSSSKDNRHTLFALEELAKFYEHRRRDYSFARELCRRALAILEIWEATSDIDLTVSMKNFEYRLRRIEKKIQRNA